MSWAAEWSRYCAIIFHKTTSAQNSDIRVDFNAGEPVLGNLLANIFTTSNISHNTQGGRGHT